MIASQSEWNGYGPTISLPGPAELFRQCLIADYWKSGESPMLCAARVLAFAWLIGCQSLALEKGTISNWLAE